MPTQISYQILGNPCKFSEPRLSTLNPTTKSGSYHEPTVVVPSMAQSAMSNTLMPFLYQTRTIHRVARVRIPLKQATSASTSLRCTLHTSIRRAREDIPFELPPDVDLSNFDRSPEDADGAPVDTITPTERQAFERIFQDIAERGQKPKLPSVPNPTAAQEKPAPAASRLLAALQGGASKESGRNKKDELTHTINTIVGDAAKVQKATQTGPMGLDPSSPLATTYSAAQRETALLRFPPTLRRAARTAFGMLDAASQAATVYLDNANPEGSEASDSKPADVTTHRPESQLERVVQIEAQRREERLRIKALMDGCSNDFELWEVIENDVFALVGRLGASDAQRVSATPTPPQPAKRGRKKKGKVQEEAAQTPAQASVSEPSPEAVLNMEVYGPLYPQLLIESLTLLDTKFARPSPYLTHLLPRIKELGLLSYVLGVSTSFYNQLMSMMWNRFGDAPGVLDLLEEMKHAGLYLDENSRSLVSTMQHAYTQARSRETGHFKAKLMDMPEYEPLLIRLSYWTSQIDRSIKERRAGWRARVG